MQGSGRPAARRCCGCRGRRRTAAGAALLLALAGPLPAQALVVMETPELFALVSYTPGGRTPVGQGIQARSSFSTTEAEATLTVAPFTPPAGAQGDTGFLAAQLDAYQDALGFNAARVSGGFANGPAVNRLFARTDWYVDFTVLSLVLPRTEVRLEYLLFPGEVGLGSFGSFAAEAGVRYRVNNQVVGEVVLSRVAGQSGTTLNTSGPFAGQALSVGTEVRGGMTYDVVRTEPYVGAMNLGSFIHLALDTVEYTMEAWVDLPGFEAVGFAGLGDPFALRQDPQASLQRAFPGLQWAGMRVVDDAAPAGVPEPAPALLLAAGLLAAARRRAAISETAPATD